jgi:hypothetical protein
MIFTLSMATIRFMKIVVIAVYTLAFVVSTNCFAQGCLTNWGKTLLGIPDPPVVQSAVAVAAGEKHALALLPDGSVVGWGFASYTVIPPSATNVISISTAFRHSVAARADGTVISWPATNPSLTPPPNATNVVAVAAGEGFSAALRRDGTVVMWGDIWNFTGEETIPVPQDLANVAAISAGHNHLLALMSNGTVRVFGAASSDHTNWAAELTDVVAISAKLNHSLALRRDGRLAAYGQMASLRPSTAGFAAIACGYYHDVALRTNGTVVSWGTMGTDVSAWVPLGLSKVQAIAAGLDFTVAVQQPCFAPTLSPITATPRPNVCVGQPITLSIEALGDSKPFTFQWFKNDLPIDGANASRLEVTTPVHRDRYTCAVTSSCNKTAVSDEITLSLIETPAAPNKSFSRSTGASLKVSVLSINPEAKFHAVGASSQGATITFDADYIYYLPGSEAADDTFTYTLSNGYCLATGLITVTADGEADVSVARRIDYSGGEIRILFHGIPGVSYSVQRCASYEFPAGDTQTVLTTNVPAGGEFLYSETPIGSGSVFFRLMH